MPCTLLVLYTYVNREFGMFKVGSVAADRTEAEVACAADIYYRQTPSTTGLCHLLRKIH